MNFIALLEVRILERRKKSEFKPEEIGTVRDQIKKTIRVED